MQTSPRKLNKHLGQRSREQHGLPVLGHTPSNVAHLPRKSHLKQSISLVENYNLDRIKLEVRDFKQMVGKMGGMQKELELLREGYIPSELNWGEVGLLLLLLLLLGLGLG